MRRDLRQYAWEAAWEDAEEDKEEEVRASTVIMMLASRLPMDVFFQINESVWIPLIFISSVALIFGLPNAAPAACLVLAIIWVHGSFFAQWQ